MKKILLSLALLLLASTVRADCTKSKTDLEKELKAFDEKPVAATETLPLMQHVSVPLEDSAKVKLLAKPDKTFDDGEKTYAGLFTISAKTKGQLIVAAGSKLWVDLIDAKSNRPVHSSKFERLSDCSKIFKVVTFPVEADHAYKLQVTSATHPTADLIVSIH